MNPGLRKIEESLVDVELLEKVILRVTSTLEHWLH